MRERTFNKQSAMVCAGLAIIFMYIYHLFYKTTTYRGSVISFAPVGEHSFNLFARSMKLGVFVLVFAGCFMLYRLGLTEKGKSYSVSYFKTTAKRVFVFFECFVIVYILTQLFSGLIGITRTSVYGSAPGKQALYTLIDGLGLANWLGTPTYNSTWCYVPMVYMLIIIIPLFAKLLDEAGFGPFLVMSVVAEGYLLSIDGIYLNTYLPVALLAVVCARYNVMETILDYASESKGLYAGITVGALALSALGCFAYVRLFDYGYLIHAATALALCVFAFLSINAVPVLSRIFETIGLCSVNMFLFHTLFYKSRSALHNFTFSFRHPALIVLVLLAVTMIIAFGLVYIRKLIDMLFSVIKKSIGKGADTPEDETDSEEQNISQAAE